MADVAAGNLQATRELRRLSMRQLSARLRVLGRPLLPSGVVRLEAEEAAQRRRLDVDDLAALALALDTSPAFLLTPSQREQVAVTPEVSVRGHEVGTWVRGQEDLWIEGDSPERRGERQRAFLEAAPEDLQRQARVGMHPLVLAIGGMEAFVRDALDPEGRPQGTPSNAGLAKGLRNEAKRVQQYAELLADELERRDDRAGR